jgi:hypothetical protein
MSLSPEVCLRGVVDTIQNRVVPALTDGFSIEAARLASLVLGITANSIDDAAAIRFSENAAMRELFRDAAAGVTDAGLIVELNEAGHVEGSGLKISELDADNDRLRRLLVTLHTYVEAQSNDAARAIDRRIWRMLSGFEVARAPRR